MIWIGYCFCSIYAAIAIFAAICAAHDTRRMQRDHTLRYGTLAKEARYVATFFGIVTVALTAAVMMVHFALSRYTTIILIVLGAVIICSICYWRSTIARHYQQP